MGGGESTGGLRREKAEDPRNGEGDRSSLPWLASRKIIPAKSEVGCPGGNGSLPPGRLAGRRPLLNLRRGQGRPVLS